MSYISQDDKKLIAAQVKPILKEYGVKGTLSIQRHSKLILTITKGPIDFINNFDENLKFFEQDKRRNDRGYLRVNECRFRDHFTGEALEFLSKVIPAMKSADWFDETDIMTDYFNIAYYLDINIGTWQKPYIFIPQ